MDLVYTNHNREDLGVLMDYSFDLAFGSSENNFELSVKSNNHVCEAGGWIYIDGTEYGGSIDSMRVETASKLVVYCGRTYHGILNSKIICPDAGKDYYSVSGEVNAVINRLLIRLGLTDLFVVPTTVSDINIKNYQFNRYTGGYDGISKMLESVGCKLHMAWTGNSVLLTVEPVVNYSEDEELDSDHVEFTISQSTNLVNHLICLGRGELKDREVVHLYADENGNISQTQTFTGLEEYTEVYDYSSVESMDELIEGGTKQLNDLRNSDDLKVQLNDEYAFDIGDIIQARDNVTGIVVTRKVTKKIVTIKKDQFKIQYKVGE